MTDNKVVDNMTKVSRSSTQNILETVESLAEINDGAHETDKTNGQIKFKVTMLKSSLCDYSDAFILVKQLKHSQTRLPQKIEKKGNI